MFPLVEQEVIKTALNGVLISTIGLTEFYETMTFPVDLDKKEIVPEVLSEARAKTKEGALHNHTEAYLRVSSAIRPAIKSFVEGSKMLDAQVLERLRKDY
jgi:hypothetical protein